jgi:asparagine synthase (glutamine-hydrolysing)
MCGVCGGVGINAQNSTLLERQLDSIRHRGPDDVGLFYGDEVSLGMCRLAIVDIESGKQPSSDRQNLIKLVFNGEIFNYRELAKLISREDLTSEKPTEGEVLIHLYLRFGTSFLEKLNGMFAIALYDTRDKSLLLARDRMGKKPLWYSRQSNGTLTFASEIRALMLEKEDLTFRTASVLEVLRSGYVQTSYSTFEEINQVPPGSYLVWRDGKFSVNEYWVPTFTPKNSISYEEALEETERLIENAVQLRLLAERPIGSFLSGGYDSTVVTSYMAKLSTQRVQTYSIGFRDSEYDESQWAAKVAAHIGTDHHQEIVEPDPALILSEISNVLDQPFADSSFIPTYLLSKFARRDLVVALGGDGGDEIFGGYDRYLAAPILQRANFLLQPIGAAADILSAFNKNLTPRKVARLKSQLTRKGNLYERYSSIVELVEKDLVFELLHSDLRREEDLPYREHLFDRGKLSNLDRMVRFDLENYLPGDLLVKADIASMANSLELRSPLLDVNVVEWALTLPDKYKVKNFETKHILKDIARRHVPAELVDRPKMGFAIPRARWLREELRDMSFDLLTDKSAQNRGWFNPKVVSRTLKEHQSGMDRDNVIWPMIMLELWARNWLDS